MLSQTAEYALRAIVVLAQTQGEARTVVEIAATSRVPVGYLAKIMHQLARSRLVTAQRGMHGGYTLKGTPGEMTMYDVVQAVDPIYRITECPLKHKKHGLQLCALHRRLDSVIMAVEQALQRTTLAQLLVEQDGSVPFCGDSTIKQPSNTQRTKK